MKAIVNTPDGPTIADCVDPDRRPNESLVAVRAFSVNRGELALLEKRTDGWRPGQDIAGVVVEAAADGSGPPAGERVVALVEQAGWAELVAVPTDRLAVLPDDVGLTQAAALPLAGLTALRTLRLGGPLLGRRTMVIGASGGVGGMQVQLAAAAGAEVTAVAGARHHTELFDLGAVSVGEDPATAKGLHDLVIDWVGGTSLAAAIAAVAPGGTVVLASGTQERTPISIYDFLGHEGARIVSYLSYAHPSPPAADLAFLARLVAGGRLDPRVGRAADWLQLADVLGAFKQRRIVGKPVLTIG